MTYRSLYLVTSKLTLTMLISLKKRIAIELSFKKKMYNEYWVKAS